MTPIVYSPAGTVTAPALISPDSFNVGRRGVTNVPTTASVARISFAGVVLYVMVASTPDGSLAVTVLLKCGWAIAAAAVSSVSVTDAVMAFVIALPPVPRSESIAGGAVAAGLARKQAPPRITQEMKMGCQLRNI